MSEHDPINAEQIHTYADGELPPEQAEAIRLRAESDETLRRRIRFARTLRERVGRALDQPAPEALVERVRAALRDAQPAGAAPVAGRVAPARRSWLSGPARANPLAVAAVLAIVAGAVIFGIFGPSIDDVQRSRLVPGADLLTQSAVFASQEHGRCAGSADARQRKGQWKDPAEAPSLMAAHLGVAKVPTFDLTSVGYEFVGAGPCGLPGAEEHSTHVIFKRPPTEDKPGAMVSIFIAHDEGQYDWSSLGDLAWSDGGAAAERCVHKVLYCHRSELVFFLVCCDVNDLPSVQEAVVADIRRAR